MMSDGGPDGSRATGPADGIPPASSSVEAAAADLIVECQVNVPYEEYADDVEHRLGRANGNVHFRRRGVEGVHDGQVMVRLKKKRFVILDYGIEPNESDLMFAESTPHVKILDGAGRRKCTMSNCTKIGVPVCLWDSEPEEVDSLYLRSGLCFTCQRNLNEKRRTERKRAVPLAARHPHPVNGGVDGAHLLHPAGALVPSIICAIGPTAPKRFRTAGGGGGGANGDSSSDILELTHDAVIINAPSGLISDLVHVDKRSGDGIGGEYEPSSSTADLPQQPGEYGRGLSNSGTSDGGGGGSLHDVSGGGLLRSTRDALADVERLIVSAGENHGLDSSTSAVAAATAAAVAAAVAVGEEASHDLSATAAATASHLLEQEGNSARDIAISAPSVQTLYEKALTSLIRSIYLMHQWKTSWDAAVETVSDPHFADAVASAAAVAAAAGAVDSSNFHVAPSVPTEPGGFSSAAPDAVGNSMVSLLLAADDKQRQIGEGIEDLEQDHQSSLEVASRSHRMLGDDDHVEGV